MVDLDVFHPLSTLLSPIMGPCFRVNGSCSAALVLGFIGGYPVGAKTAVQLYQSGQCSQAEATRLLVFCNNCGPAFMLGVAGAELFQSQSVGWLLYGVHIISALLVGLLARFYPVKTACDQKSRRLSPEVSIPFSTAFLRAVNSSMQSCLSICACVLCFSVLVRLLSVCGILSTAASLLSLLLAPLGLNFERAQQLILGTLELSTGISSLFGSPSSGNLPLAAFMLGWAGLSVHCQVLSVLSGSGLSAKPCVVGKLLHGVLSAVLVCPMARICSISLPAFCPAAGTYPHCHPTMFSVLLLSVGTALGLWLCLWIASLILGKK